MSSICLRWIRSNKYTRELQELLSCCVKLYFVVVVVLSLLQNYFTGCFLYYYSCFLHVILFSFIRRIFFFLVWAQPIIHNIMLSAKFEHLMQKMRRKKGYTKLPFLFAFVYTTTDEASFLSSTRLTHRFNLQSVLQSQDAESEKSTRRNTRLKCRPSLILPHKVLTGCRHLQKGEDKFIVGSTHAHTRACSHTHTHSITLRKKERAIRQWH